MAVRPVEDRLRAKGGDYRIEEDGQFRAQQEASTRLLVFGTGAVVGVFLLLCRCLGSWRAALMVLGVNVPLAGLGAVAALLLLNRPDPAVFEGVVWWKWPGVWVQATTLSVAHWVGFITLIGIVSRNGIMMIAHYVHLMAEEGEAFGEKMIVRGSLERLAPVLMTAAVAVIGLVPLALGKGQTGKEVLHPLAVVVIGGLVTSTLMDQVVTPAVFLLFGRKVYRPDRADSTEVWDDAWYTQKWVDDPVPLTVAISGSSPADTNPPPGDERGSPKITPAGLYGRPGAPTTAGA